MPATVIEVQAKSMLNRVNAPSMPFRWSLNPYRGCVHACVYCYARRYHEYLDLGPGQDFETIIFAKVNGPEVLRQELSRPGWRHEWVAIGTAVDPYQPAEGRYRLTRRLLMVLRDFWTPCSLVTKNSMILRDLDVLRDLALGPGCSVAFSITTVDEELAERIEPDVPPVRQRLRVMKRLSQAGIHTGVLLAPVLPGLTDDAASLEAVVRATAAHGARFLHGGILRLEGSVRNVYEQFLSSEAPHLLGRYRALYRGAYADRQYQARVLATIGQLKARYGLSDRSSRSPGPAVDGAALTPGIIGFGEKPAVQMKLPLVT